MVRNSDEIIGISVCALSGVVILISLLFPFIGTSSILELFALRNLDSTYWIYIIPFWSGITILFISGLLFINNRVLRISLYILLILSMNFIFYFLLRAIEDQPRFIWKYPSVYITILGICFLLLGLILTFSAQLKKQEY